MDTYFSGLLLFTVGTTVFIQLPHPVNFPLGICRDADPAQSVLVMRYSMDKDNRLQYYHHSRHEHLAAHTLAEWRTVRLDEFPSQNERHRSDNSAVPGAAVENLLEVGSSLSLGFGIVCAFVLLVMRRVTRSTMLCSVFFCCALNVVLISLMLAPVVMEECTIGTAIVAQVVCATAWVAVGILILFKNNFKGGGNYDTDPDANKALYAYTLQF